MICAGDDSESEGALMVLADVLFLCFFTLSEVFCLSSRKNRSSRFTRLIESDEKLAGQNTVFAPECFAIRLMTGTGCAMSTGTAMMP